MKTCKLIIIGAGPAGISMAAEAIRSGIDSSDVVVLEKAGEHSFSIRKFYPEQKLVAANYKGHAAICRGVMCIDDRSKAETLSYIDRAIADYGIRVFYNETVWKIQKNGGFEVSTDRGEYKGEVCAIAIGMMGKPNRPDYSIPAEVRKKVHFDITSTPIGNQKVLVVGGGDSAGEYVQYLKQEGNRVTLSYRRKDFSRMNELNGKALRALADRGEVDLLLESNVKGLAPSGEGGVAVTFEEEGRQLVFDHVVLALGGTTPKNFLQLLGIEFNGDQPLVKEGFETSIPGLFLLGDLSAGRRGGSIITAFNSAHEAMKKVCEDYLACRI